MSDEEGGIGGKIGGCIGTIVIIGILNLLSYLFDWGWFFY